MSAFVKRDPSATTLQLLVLIANMSEDEKIAVSSTAEEDVVIGVEDSPTKKDRLDLESDASSASADNPFADPNVACYYAKVYEDSKYECRHIFDPNLTWTEDEVKKVVLKIDLRVCFWACIMFFGSVQCHFLSSESLISELHMLTTQIGFKLIGEISVKQYRITVIKNPYSVYSIKGWLIMYMQCSTISN